MTGSVFDIVYVASLLIALFYYHVNSRQYMMILKVFAGVLVAIYFWHLEAWPALIAASISVSSCTIQAFFSDHMLEKTKNLRIGVAVVMATIGAAVSASNSGEALPLIAVIISRTGEAQASRQHIRFAYLLSQMCWLVYIMNMGLVLVFAGIILEMMSNMSAIWKHEQEQKKRVSIAVRST